MSPAAKYLVCRPELAQTRRQQRNPVLDEFRGQFDVFKQFGVQAKYIPGQI